MTRTKEEILNWYSQYLTGMSMPEIDKLYSTQCAYHFKKYNLPSKSCTECKLERHGRMKIKNNLKEINNEYDAYILGLWFADGSISRNQSTIGLSQTDSALLEQIRDYLSPDLILRKDKSALILKISSMDFKNNLVSHGITKNKSYTDFSIPLINKELQRHFIRGYFDGDGTVYMDGKYLRFNICSITMNILTEISLVFNEFHIESKINTEIREGKLLSNPQGKYSTNYKNMHRLFVRKNESLYKLFNFLYEDATIYLERKYQKFYKYVNTEVNNQITKG